jgi:hypothetical protein
VNMSSNATPAGLDSSGAHRGNLSTPAKLLAIVGAVLGMMLFVGISWVCLSLWTMLDSLCGDTLIAKEVAPSGDFSAELFEHNCGAIDPFRTVIVITDQRLPKWLPSIIRRREIFRAEVYPDAVAIKWASSDELVVSYLEEVEQRIQRQRSSWRAIDLKYEIVDEIIDAPP